MAIGYACITVDVPGSKLSGCMLKNATEDNIRRIIKNNLSALDTMLDYNMANGIRLFRISSDIIPFASHPENTVSWWVDYRDELSMLGDKIKNSCIRVSMHPGQYTVLNSPDSRVVQNAIKDLEYQERFLSSLKTDGSSKLVLHLGGIYHDKHKAMETFINNYEGLSGGIKQRLVIENDDRNYNIEDILTVADGIGIPAVFDNLHHLINPPVKVLTDSEWISLCSDTWRSCDGRQKIHYSQQQAGKRPGSHSDTINTEEFLSYYKKLPWKEPDIMLEVKDKNRSAVKCIHAVDEYHSQKHSRLSAF